MLTKSGLYNISASLAGAIVWETRSVVIASTPAANMTVVIPHGADSEVPAGSTAEFKVIIRDQYENMVAIAPDFNGTYLSGPQVLSIGDGIR